MVLIIIIIIIRGKDDDILSLKGNFTAANVSVTLEKNIKQYADKTFQRKKALKGLKLLPCSDFSMFSEFWKGSYNLNRYFSKHNMSFLKFILLQEFTSMTKK